MKLVSMNCPACNARLELDMDRMQAYCPYCGNKLLIDDEVQRTEVDITEASGYNFEKGRQRARYEAEMEERRLAEERRRRAYEEEQRKLEEQRLREEEERRIRREHDLLNAPRVSKKRCTVGLILGLINSVIGFLVLMVCLVGVVNGEDYSWAAAVAIFPMLGITIPALINSIRGAVMRNGAKPILKGAAVLFTVAGPLMWLLSIAIASLVN